jgi:hypothetical protein
MYVQRLHVKGRKEVNKMNAATQTEVVDCGECVPSVECVPCVTKDDNFIKFLLLKWKCILVFAVLLTIILNLFFVFITSILKGGDGVKAAQTSLEAVVQMGSTLQHIFSVFNQTRLLSHG